MDIKGNPKMVAILIPVFNRLDYTQKCLIDLSENLSKYPEDFYKIVVINDGSSDNTSEWITKNFPSVELLQGDGSLFWSGGINMGAKYAFYENEFEYVLLWNNDITLHESYFDNLFRIIIEEKPQGIVGTKILTLLDRNIVWSYGGYFNTKTGKCEMIGYFEQDNDSFKHKRDVDWCTGMGTLVNRHVVKKIGLWDQKLFPQYYGDIDFSYRAKIAGFPVSVDPTLIIYNETSNTGLRAQEGLNILIRSLFSFKSNICIRKNVAFLKRHSTSRLSYIYLFFFYIKVFFGYFKWRILHIMGIRRKIEKFYNTNL